MVWGRVVVIGLEWAVKLLKAKETAAADLSEVYDTEVDELVRGFFDEQFTTEGEAGGMPWKPLTQTTVMFKDRFGPAKEGSSAVLQNEMILRRSLTIRGAAMGIYKITPNTYIRGTSRRGAAAHQEGFTQTHVFGQRRKMPKKIPPRKLVPDRMPSPFVSELERIITDFVKEA